MAQQLMLRFVRRGRRAKYVVLAISLFLTLACFTLLHHAFSRPPPPPPPLDFYAPWRAPERLSWLHLRTTSSDWWIDFFQRLESTRVRAAPIYINGTAPLLYWKPGTNATRPELLRLPADNETTLAESHASIVSQLGHLSRRLPYDAGTTGIVTTAGVHSFGQVVTQVLMARLAGSRLPMQIVLESTSPWIDFMCTFTLPRHNATCLLLDDVWAGVQAVPKLAGYQWKFAAILASRFQKVLFLDADCFPVRNPDPIFEPGAEPFTSTGLITWPDLWTATSSPHFYQIAGGLEVPPVTARATSESGIMVYDKARHADSLLLAAYYNYNGPEHYYALFTQHGAGEGDKETFLQAALVLDELRRKGAYEQPTAWMDSWAGVKKGYWDVKKIPKVYWRMANVTQRDLSLLQGDPMDDYQAVMAAVEKEKEAKKASTEAETEPPPPAESDDEKAAFLTDSTFLATTSNLTVNPDLPRRIMFIHHNNVKLDLTRITDPNKAITATGADGRYVRLWGDPTWIIALTGHDVEKVFWEAATELWCAEELAGWQPLVEACGRLREVWEQVFA
jgi:alpha 1,2-mannosyltransferase